MLYIVELVVPLSRVDHLWEHLISPEQVVSLLTNYYIVRRNRSGRIATHLLTGTDYLGNCLTAAIIRTDEPGVWRVITAWDANRGKRHYSTANASRASHVGYHGTHDRTSTHIPPIT